MYTEFHFNVELRKDVPQTVIDVLTYMVLPVVKYPDPLPYHTLFAKEPATRWEHMFRCDSYYFSADTHSTLRFDNISGNYFLCVRCNFKNYDNEIELFLDWILPYIDESENFVGFWRYEEDDRPTLIFVKDTETESIDIRNCILTDPT